MDKYEYTVKTDKIRKMAAKGEFKSVAKIADSLDWSKVNDTKLLQTVAKAYEKVGRYSDAKDMLLNAYEQVPVGRRMVYKLTELSVKEGNFPEAEDFYREYLEIAPNDTGKYILRYEISAAKGEPISKLISLLEVYRRREFEEKWAYELAELYYKAKRKEDCIKLCDEIIVWFGDGEYVSKAKQLKACYGIETPERPRGNTGKITEEWNVAALEQEKALQSSMAEIMQNASSELSDSELDEDGFAAALGKTKEVVFPIVPEATRDLSDIRKVLNYSGDSIPLDLDVIQEAADEQHEAAMIEHHRWDELLGQGQVGRTGKDKEEPKTEEFVPEHAVRSEIPDDEDTARIQAQKEQEKQAEAADRRRRQQENRERRRAEAQAPAKEERETTFAASMPEELPEAVAPAKPSGSQSLEDLLKEAESLLSGVSESKGVNLEDALSDAVEKTGENAEEVIAAAKAEEVPSARPSVVPADSVKNMLDDEKMAAREAAASLKSRIEKASERANQREENARAQKEARVAEAVEKQQEAPSAPREEVRKEKAAASEKVEQAPAAASGKPAARCAFLEANDPEHRLERAMDSLEKMHVRLGTESGKAARIKADRLNERGVAATLAKLSGRDLIVESASLLDSSVVDELAEELKASTTGGVILLVDDAASIQKLIPRCRALKGCCSYIRDKAPAPSGEGKASGSGKTPDEEKPAVRTRKPGGIRQGAARKAPEKKGAMSMHDFAKCVEEYARKLECELDDKAGLAIYARAEQLMEDGVELTEDMAREVTDEAVVQAEKPSFRGVFSGKYNKDGFLILREQHFMK